MREREPMLGFFPKPWGGYWILVNEPEKRYTVKKLRVDAGAKLSTQSHKKRAELWVPVEGSGEAGLGWPLVWTPFVLHQSVCIELRMVHTMRAGPNGLGIIEVMNGDYDEYDVSRYEDDYGRKTVSIEGVT